LHRRVEIEKQHFRKEALIEIEERRLIQSQKERDRIEEERRTKEW